MLDTYMQQTDKQPASFSLPVHGLQASRSLLLRSQELTRSHEQL